MRLTEYARSAGCAGKPGPRELDLAIRTVPRQHIPEVLVGCENSDDAGVYQLTPGLALVQIVDYFPAIVDDPYTFGRITAANAQSDIDAMGGQNEAGAALLGGHSVHADEIQFGYARSHQNCAEPRESFSGSRSDGYLHDVATSELTGPLLTVT